MPWGLASKIQAARRVYYLDMRRTSPLISSKQHSGPKILAPPAETRQSEIHQISAQESPFCPSPICINLDTDHHFLCLNPQARLHLASHHIASRHTIPDSTAIATHQSISHSQQRNGKKKKKKQNRTKNFRILPLRGDQDAPCPQPGTYRSTIPSRKAA
jgi:hypothetical protein